MSDIVGDVDVDIEEELESSDCSHAYVICTACGYREQVGALVESICGRLFRLTPPTNLPLCPECARIGKDIVPDMVPCTFCGHVG